MSSLPTLLLADDSLTIQRVVSLTFADQPVRLVVAKDGQDAINRMAKERPDLVLADTNMPCVDGYELARWVRDQPHLSTVPVLLLAGVADPVDEQRLHDSGANGVLEKPFEPSHVISRVKELLGLKGAPPAPAGRLVTSPDITIAPAAPTSRKPPSAVAPQAAAAERTSAAQPVDPAGPEAASDISPSSLAETAAAVDEAGANESSTREAEAFDVPAQAGEPGDWFADDGSRKPSGAAFADEFGLSASAYLAPVDDPAARTSDSRMPAPAPIAPRSGAVSSPADVFESLLAAEQGIAAGPVMVQGSPELTPAVLDELSVRIADRLRADVQAMGADVRAALTEAVLAAVEPTLVTTVADMVRETVARQVHETVVPAIRDTVRDVVSETVRGAFADAVATSVPAAVLEAVRGDSAGDVRALVRETAERLITEEIARIRQRPA